MQPVRVLLVDDSPEFLKVAARFLSMYPWMAIVGRAHSGREAQDAVSRLHPDLVLMDMTMPDMNGLEATRRIKAQPGAPCVVMLTLHHDQHYRTAATAVGADGFVSKADVGTQLLPVITSLFDGKAGRDGGMAATWAPP